MEIPLAGSLGSAFTVVESTSTIKTSAQHLAKLAGSVVNPTILRGSVPKNGPIDFASKNHFSLNSADGKGLVPKY